MSAAGLTRREAWRLAWPMILANAAVPLAGVVDTAVIGAVGTTADLGGVALGVTLFNILYWSFYFLRMGSTGLGAQASGAGDQVELQRVLLRAVLLALVLGVGVVALQQPLAAVGFGLLQGGPAVEAAGAAYFGARVWGAAGAFAVFALSGWLIGIGHTRAVLVIHVVFSAVNILLDLWLVLGLDLAVRGVAAATAVADVAAALVGAAYARGAVVRSGGWVASALDRRALFHWTALRRLFAMNTDMMVRSWALLAGFAWFTNTAARQGPAIIAGNHVLMQIVTVWAFVLDAFAFTAETAVGRAIGARSPAALRHAVRTTSELAFACAAGFTVLTLAVGRPVLEAWIADPAAREAAIRFLPYCAVIPVIGVAAWQLDGIFIGAMRSAAMRNASVVATLVYIGADIALTGRFGVHGMWVAFLLFYVARGATLAVAWPAVARAARG